jgi:Domain of unknown function (DUF4440)
MTRMSEETLWSLEQKFWTGDAALYESRLAPTALMVLPDPAGILDREQAIESIRTAPRWAAVEFDDRREIRPAAQVVVLAYIARARRARDQTDYHARCSSTYVDDQGRWLLALHHQTVLE